MLNKKNLILKKCLLLFLISQYVYIGFSQDIYKTPSGEKYHLITCRMVKNVSMKLNGAADIEKYKLTPCQICNPAKFSNFSNSLSTTQNKAVGVSKTVQCNGITKKGTRCLHITSLANGLCYQHKK